jgi:hypothetical protein
MIDKGITFVLGIIMQRFYKLFLLITKNSTVNFFKSSFFTFLTVMQLQLHTGLNLHFMTTFCSFIKVVFLFPI